MTNMTYYDLLEVSPKASQAVIISAYRALCQKYHPDKNAGDHVASEMMAKINVAYDVLSDPASRKMYDEDLCKPSRSSESTFSYSASSTSLDEVQPSIKSLDISTTTIGRSRSWEGPALAIAVLLSVGGVYFYDSQQQKEADRQSVQNSENKEQSRQMIWNMADRYLSGDGSPQNFKHAIDMYTEMCNDNTFGDGRAERRLAEVYFYGFGVPIDYAKARMWYEKSATKSLYDSDPVPPFMLALLYDEGLGGVKDRVIAYRYYNLSAGKGSHPDLRNKAIDPKTMRSFGWDYDVKTAAIERKNELSKKLSVEEVNRAQAN